MKIRQPKQTDSAHASSAAQYLTFTASTGGDANSLELRYEEENIWLTQKMMAQLYGISKQAISQHIERLEADGEIDTSTVKQYLTVQTEGHRQIKLHAETQFEKYRVVQDRLFESDFDKYLDELKTTQKKIEGKK